VISTQPWSTRFWRPFTDVAGQSYILLYSIDIYPLFSRTVGGSSGESVPAMTDAVKEAARKELEARTGETESESDE
jgi:hypothetical protein